MLMRQGLLFKKISKTRNDFKSKILYVLLRKFSSTSTKAAIKTPFEEGYEDEYDVRDIKGTN